MLTPLQETLEELEEEAEQLREYGNGAQANAVDRVVREVRTSLPELLDQTVCYETAARIEGQTEGTIRNRVSRGDLTNVGTRGAGRIPLKDLRVGRLLGFLLRGSVGSSGSPADS
jgi:hypothetical protein